ncbi:hypothetical protein LOD99_12695 [Oopsacas minuta]|uniref:5'-deoxynucleotidase HDDC2 n=1 Tax=Oopsacas minuta TaxID=111878 RepID=A0AAV7JCS6_9METZ|nr:hypothetical protein LOD99_12695 [Oopsacas minuta]
MATEDTAIMGVFEFCKLLGVLKHLDRTGWVRKGVDKPESVAGHMYRMALLSFLATTDPSIDRNKCIKLSLVHDLGESIVGDITPLDGVSKEEKYKKEKSAIERISSLLPESVGNEISQLWEEYEKGETPESVYVKDLDKFDMIFQAYEYETSQNMDLQEFFTSTEDLFRTDQVKSWVEQLKHIRETPK